jgi:hypothetical protein
MHSPAMLFNHLLTEPKIDPAGVLVFRHTPWERGLRKVLPWLAAEHPDIFNAYLQTQSEAVEAELLRARYVASFIDWKSERRMRGTPQSLSACIWLAIIAR